MGNAFSQFSTQNFQYLDLRNNSLTYISQGMFLGNTDNTADTSLIYLDLSENLIGFDGQVDDTLPANSFNHATKLRYLSLASNYIQELKPHIFDKLVDLRYLDLSGNSIYYMNVNLFSSLPSLV